MSFIETNVFPILNLKELQNKYRLYRIRNLSPDQEEFEHNRQFIVKRLSYQLRSPVDIILKDGVPHLVLRDDTPEPTSPYTLVRTVVYFDKTGDLITLDYEHPTEQTLPICLRFLQFAIQGALRARKVLWQPGAGAPFFHRHPDIHKNGIAVYRGFSVRVVPVETNQLGIMVNVTFRYVSQNPLPAKISKEYFRRIKNQHCVYHLGTDWYEIQLMDCSDLNVNEFIVNENGEKRTLLQCVMRIAPKPLTKEVTDVPADCSVLTYVNGQYQTRNVPSVLCYPVLDTEDNRVRHLHTETQLSPQKRRKLVTDFVSSHLSSMPFNNGVVKIGTEPVVQQLQYFRVPDMEFGHNTILSVKGTTGKTQVSLDRLGRSRTSALFDQAAGPYTARSFDAQYFVIPRTVLDSYASAFLKDLRATVDQLYPAGPEYDPILIPYDDDGPKTFAGQGNAILRAVDLAKCRPGFGIVMLHETVDRGRRQPDQLAAMVMRKLRDRGLYVSVVHTTTSKDGYELISPPNDQPRYEQCRDPKKQGRLRGYLRNVAITKVLLTNNIWPFVLATPLHADMTIGIDVQFNTCCFTFMGNSGPDIRVKVQTSKQKEKLTKGLIQSLLLGVLRDEAKLNRKSLTSLVIHRDGRIFQSELAGIHAAIATLKAEGVIVTDPKIGIVEIHKQSFIQARLFEATSGTDGISSAENPPVGAYWIMSPNNGFVCTTGRPFLRFGSAKPLHVRYIDGNLPFEHILDDVFAFSCLAWTQPETCLRVPITIKLADIRLTEHAGGFDPDELEFADEKEEEVIAHE